MSDDTSISSYLLGGGGLVAIGGGLRWVWEKLTKRAASREAKLDAREEKYSMKLEARLDLLERTVEEQGEELERHRLALAVMVAKVMREEPNAPELRQVQEILGAAFPLHLGTPADMIESLKRID